MATCLSEHIRRISLHREVGFIARDRDLRKKFQMRSHRPWTVA